MGTIRLLPLVTLAALGACARTPPPRPPEPAPVQAPAPVASSVDGRYRGTARLVRAENRFCSRSGARTLEIDNRTVTLSYRESPRQLAMLTAVAEPDGRLHAEDGVGTLDGRLADGQLDVTVSSPMCENHLSLTKVD
jgi:hypothetical protein